MSLNKGFGSKGQKLLERIEPYIPFVYMNIIWRILLDKKGQSILDVGCGNGRPMRIINKHKHFFSIGGDASLPRLKQAKNLKSHNDYIRCDVRTLPFQEKSFDIVLCLEVIEHLPKEEGIRFIESLERIARKQVIIGSPVDFMKRQTKDSYMDHVSGWTPNEFRFCGYKVIGRGMPKIIPAQWLEWFDKRLPDILRRVLLGPLALFAGPYVYFYPSLAKGMVCTKLLTMSEV